MSLPVASVRLVQFPGWITPVEEAGAFGTKAVVEPSRTRPGHASTLVYCEPTDRRLRKVADEALLEAMRDLGVTRPLAIVFFADAVASDGRPQLTAAPEPGSQPGTVVIRDLVMAFYRPRLPSLVHIRLWAWDPDELRTVIRHEVAHARQLDEGRRLGPDSTEAERAAYESEANNDAHTRTAPGVGYEPSDGTIVRATLGRLPGGDFGLAIYNPQSTVIIDGTSDVFKIAASGTLSITTPAWTTGNVTTASASATLTGLGTLSSNLGVYGYLATNNVNTGQRFLGGTVSPDVSAGYVATTSGGAVNFSTIVMDYLTYLESQLNGSSQEYVSLVGFGVSAAQAWYAKYYVLQETAL